MTLAKQEAKDAPKNHYFHKPTSIMENVVSKDAPNHRASQSFIMTMRQKQTGLSQVALTYFKHSFQAMGTLCEIQLFGPNTKYCKQACDYVISDIDRLERKYSRYRADSYLSEINRIAASGGTLLVDDETASLIHYAATCYEQSDGLFDISAGILRRAWNFRDNKLPRQADIDKLLEHIGWQKVRWNAPELSFGIEGMELDLGGVVKEYAADRAVQLCKQLGIQHGLVNLGGDISLIGPRPDAAAWQIGLRHPEDAGKIMTSLSLSQGAVASSGDYERSMIIDNRRYGHIINPITGWPTRHLMAVTVISDFCVIAGSASTIAILKEDEGPAWLTSLKLPHLWVDHRGRIGGNISKLFAT